jgi:hypothetical protein
MQEKYFLINASGYLWESSSINWSEFAIHWAICSGGMKLHYRFPTLILIEKSPIEYKKKAMRLSSSAQGAGMYFLKIKTIKTEFIIPTIKFF